MNLGTRNVYVRYFIEVKHLEDKIFNHILWAGFKIVSGDFVPLKNHHLSY